MLNVPKGLKRKAVRRREVEGMHIILSPKGSIRTLPYMFSEEGGMDGFFVARFEKVEDGEIIVETEIEDAVETVEYSDIAETTEANEVIEATETADTAEVVEAKETAETQDA